jgi:hypothetical protein
VSNARLDNCILQRRHSLPHTFIRINVAKHVVEARGEHEVALFAALISTAFRAEGSVCFRVNDLREVAISLGRNASLVCEVCSYLTIAQLRHPHKGRWKSERRID